MRRAALPRRLPFSRGLARGLAGKPEAATSVADLFQTMQYTSAPESVDVANAWLDSHQRQFGFFVDNAWLKPEGRATATSTRPSNGAVLAETLQAEAGDVDGAVAAARRAQAQWGALSPHARSRHLYSLARHLQKHSRLLATVESLDNGKTIRETRDADVPLAVRHSYSHAGWAQVRSLP
jgi:aldehyde dehydrogenase (NAD+)